jgi:hypothetical protein
MSEPKPTVLQQLQDRRDRAAAMGFTQEEIDVNERRHAVLRASWMEKSSAAGGHERDDREVGEGFGPVRLQR